MLLAANLTPHEQTLALPFAGRARLLDEVAVLGGNGPRPVEAGSPLFALPPYALLRVEG